MISLLFFFNITTILYAETTSGILTEDETWSGTINVTGDITVPNGITLTIEPGTQIIFPAGSDDTAGGQNSNLSELLINGSLIAAGTDVNPIIFSSDAATKSKSDWGGIQTTWNIGFKTFNLEYCEIEYASHGVIWKINEGMHSVGISNSKVNHTSGNGIYIYGEAGSKISLDINNTDITDNNGRGIYCNITGSS
ncbi:MAG: hypothetical protein K8S13_19635, partial [Desulfobacula sp.]|uniref:hypothetical protein n=1 Tax=Desulfobacula sp. TaxID=2593537 RepID=UPI0025C4E44B